VTDITEGSQADVPVPVSCPPCRDESLQESPVWNSEELVRLWNLRTAGVAA
jgi:hypothetical protein